MPAPTTGNYGGSSAGVLQIRVFPRTDYVWAPNVPPTPPFDPDTGGWAAPSSQMGVFRMAEVRSRDDSSTTLVTLPDFSRTVAPLDQVWRGFRSKSHQRWYMGDPFQDGWIFSGVPPFDATITVAAIDELIRGFRPPGRAVVRVRDTEVMQPSSVRYIDVPLVAGLWQHGERTRPADTKPRMADWMVPFVSPERFIDVPTVGGLWAHGDRTRARDMKPRPTEPQSVWMPASVFDPALFPATQNLTERTPRRPNAVPQLDDPIGWWVNYLSVFDPAVVWPGIEQLLRAFRSTLRPTVPLPTEPQPVWMPAPVFDPALWPAIRIEGLERARARSTVIPAWQDPIGWWLATFPAFDPALIPAMAQLSDAFRARDHQKLRQWIESYPDYAWIFTAVPPPPPELTGGVYIPIFRPRRR